MRKESLTQNQEKFCLAYIETGNASGAYRRAYNAGKMKAETINRRAFDLMQNGKVTARISDLRASVVSATVVSEARAIEEAARIGLFDPDGLFAADGSLLPIKQMPPEVRAAIASIEVNEVRGSDGKIVSRLNKVKLWDKNSALEKILRHLGSFERDNKQRAGLLADLPRETLKLVLNKLQALKG